MLEWTRDLPLADFFYSDYGLLLALCVGGVFGAFFLFRIRKMWGEYRGRKFRKRGKKAEVKAAKLLKKAGYAILEREPRIESVLKVRGKLKAFVITPDYKVKKNHEIFMVEVKSHGDRYLVNQAEVRRQLVEYMYATGFRCLLVTTLDSEISCVDLVFREEFESDMSSS